MPKLSLLLSVLGKAALLAGWLLGGASLAWCSEPLRGAVMGSTVNYDQFKGYRLCAGDVRVNTWADDGELYSLSDDTDVPGGNANFATNKLSGDDPRRLTRTVTSAMTDYGPACRTAGRKTAAGKATACSALTACSTPASAATNTPGEPATHRQTSQNGSIIKSLDHGKTWVRSMQENWKHPTFPGRKFATPFFIQYGQNCSVRRTVPTASCMPFPTTATGTTATR